MKFGLRDKIKSHITGVTGEIICEKGLLKTCPHFKQRVICIKAENAINSTQRDCPKICFSMSYSDEHILIKKKGRFNSEYKSKIRKFYY